MNHCMIDIETLGNNHDAVILSIGAVAFSLDRKIHGQFLGYPCVDEQLQNDRKINKDTICWWMGQSKEAQEVFHQEADGDLWDVLYSLDNFYQQHECQRVWSHGATFDCSILAHAYGSQDQNLPWGFRDVRDTRTLYELYPDQTELKAVFRHTHDCVEDAIDQAKIVCMVYEYLQKGTK